MDGEGVSIGVEEAILEVRSASHGAQHRRELRVQAQQLQLAVAPSSTHTLIRVVSRNG
jgi:hypothetical protein